jgi:hypothetical protein
MRIAILVIWSVGLLGALPATLVVLKLAQLVVSALMDIARLCVLTRTASEGIARNVAAVPTLPALGTPAAQLSAGAQRLATAAREIDLHLAQV